MVTSNYFRKLKHSVLKLSESKEWDHAVNEWKILRCIEDPCKFNSCVCGKEGLLYLFTIKNTINGNILSPIGSTCIKKFGRKDLEEEVSITEQLFRLCKAIEDGRYIELSTKYFSRKLLKYFYDDGAFIPTRYNDYDGKKDYEFILKIFNRGGKGSTAQHRKVDAVIINSIKPYLYKKLEEIKSEKE